MLVWLPVHQMLKVCVTTCNAIFGPQSNISRFSGFLSFHYMYQYVYAGSFRLPYFPAEAVFAVTRNGSKTGFRSLG